MGGSVTNSPCYKSEHGAVASPILPSVSSVMELFKSISPMSLSLPAEYIIKLGMLIIEKNMN